ncbi:MAG TPA: serine/threonine-protein kinase [Kofleriaceae bacterium]|nr:serine/threonine-protein kinase [Kofleriaceae bacterium]
MTGAVLDGTYTVEHKLGAGGMGEVYVASHARLAKRFAVKFLHGRVHADDEAFARFRREAQIASQLGHPNIAQVVDFNETANGTPYMVLELLEGETLGDRLAREGRFSVELALGIVDQIASALGTAHEREIVHRDLKPPNVFLCATDDAIPHVKVLDFGIGKMRGDHSQFTGRNSLLGTPDYMAPEQAEGRSRDVDARCDQFALAIMLHEMLTGERPFAGDSVLGTLYQIVNHEPTSLDQAAGAPPALATAVRRALSKDPAARFPSIRAFARAARGQVDDAIAVAPHHGPPIPTPTTGRSTGAHTGPDAYGTTFSGSAGESIAVSLPRARWPMLVGGAALVLAVAAVWIWRASGDDPAPAAIATPLPEPAPPAPIAAPDAAVPAPPATIIIRFDVQPAPDRVLLDGAPVDPTEVSLARGATTHELRFEKDGHRSERLSVSANASQIVRVRLTPESRRRPRRVGDDKGADRPTTAPADQDFILDF